MAHSPKVRAAACADLLLGMSQRDVAAKHGVGKSAVAEWAAELKTGHDRAKPTDDTLARQRYREELQGLMVEMVRAPRRLLQRIADDEAEAADPERLEAVAALLRAASDTGLVCLQAAAVILDARGEQCALPGPGDVHPADEPQ